jgi:hypothetical protein
VRFDGTIPKLFLLFSFLSFCSKPCLDVWCCLRLSSSFWWTYLLSKAFYALFEHCIVFCLEDEGVVVRTQDRRQDFIPTSSTGTGRIYHFLTSANPAGTTAEHHFSALPILHLIPSCPFIFSRSPEQLAFTVLTQLFWSSLQNLHDGAECGYRWDDGKWKAEDGDGLFSIFTSSCHTSSPSSASSSQSYINSSCRAESVPSHT